MKMIVMLVSIISLSAGVAFAEGAAKAGKQMTKEQREKMAISHDKMAVCLRTDKTMEACHEEMQNSCGEDMGEHGCHMMGGKGMKMKHKKMMNESSEKSESEH